MRLLPLLLIGCKLTLEPTPDSSGADDSAEVDSEGDDSEPDDSEPDDTAPLDADGDGAPAAEDCDDADPAVFPGAEEVCGDGVVNDCAGSVEQARQDCGGLPALLETADALASLAGEVAQDAAGISVAGVGDMNEDGTPDLLIGARAHDSGGENAGVAYLVSGASRGVSSLGAAMARLDGAAAGQDVGGVVQGSGDLTGDGLADLVISANGWSSDTGAAWVLPGPVTGDHALGEHGYLLTGEATGDLAGGGRGLSAIGDVNEDGVEDLLVGAYSDDSGGADAGAAYLVLGPIQGDLELAGAAARWRGAVAGEQAGWSVSSAGDTDGDGLDELLIGARAAGGGPSAVYLVESPGRGVLSLQDSLARLEGEEDRDEAGYMVAGAGDTDGDGLEDILVGARNAGALAGVAYLMLGPVTGQRSLGDAEAQLEGRLSETEERALMGTGLASVGDMDGDGRADLLVGASYQDQDGATDAGEVGFFFGPLSGSRTMLDADTRLQGPTNSALFGVSVSAVGDVDGDGATDLLIGASQNNALGTPNAGSAYLFSGGGAF
ncbi:MAG: FG-GAP repeat protein [Alphaproteobacteria bacterium]|nr:FG-GAP repeat protein [Alphaproteobacteria bacterium]